MAKLPELRREPHPEPTVDIGTEMAGAISPERMAAMLAWIQPAR